MLIFSVPHWNLVWGKKRRFPSAEAFVQQAQKSERPHICRAERSVAFYCPSVGALPGAESGAAGQLAPWNCLRKGPGSHPLCCAKTEWLCT